MTSEQKQLAAIIFGGILLVMLISTWFWGYNRGKRSVAPECPVVDTITVVDTHYIERPVEVWRTKEKVVYLPVKDSTLVTIHDTLYVALNREKKGYSGEDYECEVSGIEVNLDWIKTFPKTVYVNNTIQDMRRWTFGVTLGPGVLYDGNIHGGIGLVAGVQYRF